MTLTILTSVFLVCLLGAMTPGPSLAVVMKHTMNGGRSHGLITAWSHASGLAMYALFTVLGLSLIIKQFPLAFNLLMYLGALYFAWLGFKSLCSKGKSIDDTNAKKHLSVKEGIRDGFLIVFLNPKIALWFIALFSQFVSPDASFITKALLVIIPFLVDGLWYSTIAMLLSKPTVLNKLNKNAVWLDRFMGCILLLLTLKVIFTS
ncbi:LysE family translocator [Zooshikella ganghwensis]|uniref:LysE family translocator n=1 Tax=Zooshikella ganghwensis TaxID=202772 RepID=A0A4P9VL18_9GAMM|nr:LysE family translocator [Zooshikella ganghwensis]RDH43017.1 LysE family translocator [Zooshikella ganghwensis]